MDAPVIHSEAEIRRHVQELLEDLQLVGTNGDGDDPSKKRKRLRIFRQPPTLRLASFRSLLVPRGFAPDDELDHPGHFAPPRARMAYALSVRDEYLRRWDLLQADTGVQIIFGDLLLSMRFRDSLYRMWLTQVRQPGIEGNLAAGTTWDYDAVGGDEPDTPPHPTLGGHPETQPLPDDWYRRFIDTLYVNDFMRWNTLVAYRLQGALWQAQRYNEDLPAEALDALGLGTRGYGDAHNNVAAMWTRQELVATKQKIGVELAKPGEHDKEALRKWSRVHNNLEWLNTMLGELEGQEEEEEEKREPPQIDQENKAYLVRKGLVAPGAPSLLQSLWAVFFGQITARPEATEWSDSRFPGGSTRLSSLGNTYSANPDLDPVRTAAQNLEYLRVPTVEWEVEPLFGELLTIPTDERNVFINHHVSGREGERSLVVAFDPPVRLQWTLRAKPGTTKVRYKFRGRFSVGVPDKTHVLHLERVRLAHPLNLRWVAGRMLVGAAARGAWGTFSFDIQWVHYGPRNLMPLTATDNEPRTLQLDLAELGLRFLTFARTTKRITVYSHAPDAIPYEIQRVEFINSATMIRGKPRIMMESEGLVLSIPDDPELARLRGGTPPATTTSGQRLPKMIGDRTAQWRAPIILAITWNAAGAATRKGPKRWNASPEGQAWRRWIKRQVASAAAPDLVAVALQEWNTGNRFTEALDDWLEEATGERYGRLPYTLKTLARFVGRDFSQNLTLLMREGARRKIFIEPRGEGSVCFGASKSCVKGSVAASVHVVDDPSPRRLVFVASHFPYGGDANVGARDAAYRKTLAAIPALRDPRNMVLWMGDLNYRVTYPSKRDQLQERMRRNVVFTGYREGVKNRGPTFKPTCKVRPLPKGADKERREALLDVRRRGGMFAYDVKREPSWCDRILVRDGSRGARLEVRSYTSVVDGTLESDHNAVAATVVYL